MSKKKMLKAYIIIGLLVLILLLSIFCGGSAVIRNYTPDGGYVKKDDELKEITYNYDVLDQVTGGYSGPPKLVASDDKVFYIPPEYCDGSYLKNFRVIGINQSNAKITKDAKGNITDYKGAVILYGFQTTYREDYGKNYNFDYEPYDYDAEYEVVDSYFKDVVLGQGDAEKYETSEDGTEGTSVSLYMPGSIDFTENEDAVDDSDFKVATVVMEHEIGKDECKILYCDADSCTVKDLDVGKYNLVTNLNDSALTVCYNENIYVYSFNTKDSSYGSNEVYYYKLQDLFDSITFKNTLADIGYCNVEYNVTGNVSFNSYSTGWVETWISKMSKKKTNTTKNVSYLSNLVGDTAKKDKVNSDFIDMESFVKKEVENAYSGYKKTSSGLLSYKHSTKLKDFGDYTYQKNGTNSWTLKNSFKVDLEETSWLVLFPKTYKGTAKGSVTVNITPNFTLKSEYDYSINDMILTKYNSSSNLNQYSIIIQLLITPKGGATEEETMEPITDFDAYVKDVEENAQYDDSTPDGLNEDELEAMDSDSYEESEEYIEKEIGAKYVTLNINLAQINGTEKAENIEVLSISNTAELYDYFNTAKENYKAEYDENISIFSKEVKSGPYVQPKDFTVESLNDFKEIFNEIKNCCVSLEKERSELESLNNQLDSINQSIDKNIDETNKMADSLTGEFAIKNKTNKGDTGYYKELDEKMQVISEWIDGDNTSINDRYITRDFDSMCYYLSMFFNPFDIYLNYLGIGRDTPFEHDMERYAEKHDDPSIIITEDDINDLKEIISKITSENVSNVNYGGSDVNYRNEYINQIKILSALSSDNSETDEEKLNKFITNVSSLNVSVITDMNNDMGIAYDKMIKIYDNLLNHSDLWLNDKYSLERDRLFSNNYIYKLMRGKSQLKGDYNEFIKSTKYAIEYAEKIQNTVIPLIKNEAGANIVNQYIQRVSLEKERNEYEYSLIPAKEEEIAALEARLEELKAEYDSTDFYVDLRWKGEELDSDALVKYYTSYDEIAANADEYINAYNKLLGVAEYKDSADKFINNIVTLNTDPNISRVIDNMYRAVPEEGAADKYGAAYNSLVFLKENKNRFFANISNAINNIAGIHTSVAEEVTKEDVSEENANIKLIEEYAEKYYGSMGINMIKKKTYSDVLKDCENIYNNLYESFSKVTIQQDGEEKIICDVTEEDVQNCVFALFMDKYEIYELSDYNADGSVAKTVTLAKSQASQGNVYEVTETSSETTTEALYSNLSAVYTSYQGLREYALNLNSHYKAISQIAMDNLLGSGCLTDEQKVAADKADGSLDDDITSDYNTGYKYALDISNEMSGLLDQAKAYYEIREAAAGEIRAAANKGLSLQLRDDIYYTSTYKTKCEQADHLYRLLYNAAKAPNETERNKYVEEYKSIDWIVDDIEVDDDLQSAIVVKRKEISVTYQKVDWNTSLIKADVESNASSTPYELYQMNSNFCIGISDNEGFIVPMGTQADIDVRSVNAKIDEEIKKSGISEINNVAYGSNSGFDILLFSSDSKWFMIAFKQVKGSVSVDINNVIGYSGKYSVGDEDVHFLEYDHTNITGLNQLFSTTIENGYKPYSIELRSSRNGEIKAETSGESENGEEGNSGAAEGLDGAFFNSWSDDKGNVILLGFKEEDMEVVEETSEGTTETYYEGDVEATTEEKQYREIADTDIYDAHLYVLQYDVKAAEGDKGDKETDIFDTDMGKLIDAGIRLEGPYGELLEPAVNILTIALKAVLAVVYSLAVLYCVHLGVKMSKASDDEERHKAKEHLKWFIIAVIGTHIMIAFIYLAGTQLRQWSDGIQITSGYTVEETADSVQSEKD